MWFAVEVYYNGKFVRRINFNKKSLAIENVQYVNKFKDGFKAILAY